MAQLYRITPLEKKSIEFVIECYQKLEDGDTRGFTATFLYRWGQGFRELDNPVSRWEADSDDGVSCDPTIGGKPTAMMVSVVIPQSVGEQN